MNGSEALENIKAIELWHIEHDQDEDINGEWVYTDHEVYDGTVRENYPEAIEALEKELKDYHEIKEIAKRYHWDDLARDTHMTTTDEKYLRLFNAAIPDIQADYRKARAFDIIKKKKVDVEQIIENPDMDKVIWYNTSFTGSLCESWRMLTQEEFDLLKEVLE